MPAHRRARPRAPRPDPAAPGGAIGPGRGAWAAAALLLALSAGAAWRIARALTVDPPAAPEARLRAEPLAAEAYAALALAAEGAGRGEEAARLMVIAAGWWPRDLRAQTWLLARDLRRGDLDGALARLDALARGRPEALDALTAALAPLLGDPAALAALAARLGAGPPWRARFLTVAARVWRDPDGLARLAGLLQGMPPGLADAERRPILDRLLADGRVADAYLLWLRGLPPGRLGGLGYLYNGRFAHPVTALPFDWTLPAVPGAAASVGPPASGGGPAGGEPVLTVGFAGGPVPLQPVRHGLALAPGDYRLTGRVSTDRLRAERGVRWRLACRGDPDGTLAATAPVAGTAPWRDFALDFTVPEEGCAAQILGLEVHARVPSERRASGVAAFAGLDIAPR